MARYNVFFETTQGDLEYRITIAEGSSVSSVLPDLLAELEEKGYRLAGGAADTPQVLWNGRALSQDIPLPQQGVRPSDNLRIRTQPRPAAQPKSAPVVVEQPPAKSSPGGSVALRILYCAVAFLPIWVIHYLALRYLALQADNLMLAVGAAVLGCGIALGLWYFTETTAGGIAQLIPFFIVLVALSGAVLVSQSQSDPRAWATVLPALAVGVVGGLKTRQVKLLTCGIGGESFSGMQFPCPRCGRVSCTSHWNVRRVRCSNCDQRDILWLSLLGIEWWEQRLGPSVTEGQCARCRSGPESRNAFREQRDLRECGGCGMLQCRWCWDLTNGVCANEQECGWTMPDLPSALTAMADRQAAGQRRR